jgi:hypothetical protein
MITTHLIVMGFFDGGVGPVEGDSPLYPIALVVTSRMGCR